MKQPLVTIITITYNLVEAGRREFIIQNLESVHNQSYSNIEHIIIDGASNDGTVELLKPYEEKGWIKIYSEPDSGIYDAMNKGIMRASGEYINFLNSDDYFSHLDGVKESVVCLLRDNADFSYGISNNIDPDTQIPESIFFPKITTFYTYMPFSHQTMFTKRDTMLKFGMFDTSLKSASDYDFLIRLILSGAKGTECFLNFINFRIGGFSSKDYTLSQNEANLIRMKNFNSLTDIQYTHEDYKQMRDKREIPDSLLYAIMSRVHPDIQKEMMNEIKLYATHKLGITVMYRTHFLHAVKQDEKLPSASMGSNIFEKNIDKSKTLVLSLFGLVPLISVKSKHNKVNIKLFNFIPLFKIKKT